MADFGASDICEMRLLSSDGSQLGINRIRFRVKSVQGGGPTGAAVAAALNDRFAATYKSLMSAQANFIGLEVQVLSPVKKNAFQNRAGAGAGTVTGDALPPQVAGLLSFYAADAGKKNRGRMYFPFPAESNNTVAGRPNTGYFSIMNGFGELLLGDIDLPEDAPNITINFIIWGGGANPAKPITQVRARDGWAQQRRRSFLRRPNVIPVIP